ncbi:hypothetical protein [Actinomadura atramentaria]|uniref:hypothetical protein n=1 Tax=Actinomadura atramentaria TaxID=1990 RepID=UPI0003A247CF|nr:hypothetical protein [Actinomadura atramentaria]
MTARIPERNGTLGTGGEAGAAPGSRHVRRLLAFDAADVPAPRTAPDDGRSPWVRSADTWNEAGIAWHDGPALVSSRAPARADGARERKPERKPQRKDRPERRPGARRRAPIVAGAAAVAVLAGGGAVYALARDDGARPPAVPAAHVADALFAADPARPDGLAQDLRTVAVAGSTVVAAGAETAPGAAVSRAELVVSRDGGRTFALARVRTPDESEPPLGSAPVAVAGGPGAWVALGADGTTLWTSPDALVWTLRGTGPGGHVTALARTSSGFAAVGSADGRGAVWTSPDGHEWRRAAAPGATNLDAVAASGAALVVHGTSARTVTKTVRKRGKKRKVTSTTTAEGQWVSADGGRTWTAAPIPQAQGSTGAARGLTAGPRGFYAVRAATRKTGSKKHRRTVRDAVVFASADGRRWTPAGRIAGKGAVSVERFAGAAGGLAALVRDGKTLGVQRSPDGRTWRAAPLAGRPSSVAGLGVAAGGEPVLAGRAGDDPYLAAGAPVDLRAVPGVIGVQKSVSALAAAPGLVVAVGATNGAGALWTSPDGARWTRTALDAPPASALTAVAHGPAGWLAAGRTGTASLMAASADGARWRTSRAEGAQVAAVAYGPAGYVAVGTKGGAKRGPASGRPGGAAAAWRTTDLARWSSAELDGESGKDVGKDAWMSGVAATASGYVAVGGKHAGTRDVPALWTSRDGLDWTTAAAPEPPPGVVSGSFFQVVAGNGGRLLALGRGRTVTGPTGFVAVSADGGAHWTPRTLPDLPAPAAATATPRGFVLAGSTGLPGRREITVLASADGAGWRRVAARGTGSGDQRVAALAVVGRDLFGVGGTAGHRGDVPFVWRAPVP